MELSPRRLLSSCRCTLGRAAGVAIIPLLLVTYVSSAYEDPATAPSEPSTAPAAVPSAPAKGMGMVVGVVKNADDTIAVELDMRMVQDQPMGMGGGGRGGEKLIQKTTTDKDGNYAFTNLKPGNYRIISRSQQIGWIYYDLDIPADEVTKLDLKLTKISGG